MSSPTTIVPCLIADEIACWTIRTSASPSACRVLQLIVVSQEKNEADDPTVLMAIGRKKEIHVLVKENERGIARSFVVHFILFSSSYLCRKRGGRRTPCLST